MFFPTRTSCVTKFAVLWLVSTSLSASSFIARARSIRRLLPSRSFSENSWDGGNENSRFYLQHIPIYPTNGKR